MQIYKDMLLKMKFHKEQIIKSFIQKGYFPQENEISEKLSRMDHRLALFEAYINVPGTKMNIKELNYCFNIIYKDIVFLYKVIKELTEIDLNRAKLFVEAHLTELEAKAEYYRKRNDVEVNTTTLGNTVFFAAGNWKYKTENNISEINLGEVELLEGSKIACFANVNNVIPNTVKFKFENPDPEKEFEALPYNYNNDTYIVPGELKVKIMDIDSSSTLKNEKNNTFPVYMKTNPYNDYLIMGGLWKMLITYKNSGYTFITDIPGPDSYFRAERDCYITFYVADGTEMEYEFNKRPLHTNFSMHSGLIKMKKDIHKIFIDAEKGFTCSFKIFGEKTKAWATSREAVLGGPNYIIYTGFGLEKNMNKYQVREYVKENKINYNLKAYMESDEDAPAVIDSIYIKEV